MEKPTVCSRVGGIPDFVMDGKTGLLFTSENSDELAEKLIKLVQNPDVAKKYGKALHDLALEKFSDTALAQKHIEIYSAVIADFADEKRYDCTLSGYYGFKNSGDDALLFAIIDSLKKYKPDVRICVLSADPKHTKNQYGIDSVGRFNPFGVRRALSRSKMLINGGGSLIQDATSSKSLTYYLYIMRLAKRLGAKLYVYANGIGPLKEKNLARSARVLESADMITLRENASASELERLGVKNKNVLVTADPALILTGSDESRVAEILSKYGVPSDAKILGISVRSWGENEDAFAEKIAKIADYASEKYSLVPVFIPMRYPHDVKYSEEISAKTACRSYILCDMLSVDDTIGVTAKCEAVFAMRLHTIIYATGSGVPAVGIVYDKKVSDFLDYVGEGRCLDVKCIDTEKAFGFIDEIMANKDEITASLAQKKDELYALAEKNAEIAVNLLGE